MASTFREKLIRWRFAWLVGRDNLVDFISLGRQKGWRLARRHARLAKKDIYAPACDTPERFWRI